MPFFPVFGGKDSPLNSANKNRVPVFPMEIHWASEHQLAMTNVTSLEAIAPYLRFEELLPNMRAAPAAHFVRVPRRPGRFLVSSFLEGLVVKQPIPWMDEILHHFETMTNHFLRVCTGESTFQGS